MSSYEASMFPWGLPYPALLCPSVAPSVRQSVMNLGIELFLQISLRNELCSFAVIIIPSIFSTTTTTIPAVP